MNDMIKILVCEPATDAYVKEIPNTYEALSEIVGGYIECVYPFSDMDVALICNEEGKLIGLPPNRELIRKSDKWRFDLLAGTFFFVGARDGEEDFSSLTEREIEKIRAEHRVTISAVWYQ